MAAAAATTHPIACLYQGAKQSHQPAVEPCKEGFSPLHPRVH